MGIEVLRELVSSHWGLDVWLSVSVISCTMLLIDLHHNNNHIGSITVIEVSAISLDLWLVASAIMDQPLFWNSLMLSLTVSLIAACPVKVLLVQFGVKAGMGDPRNTAASHLH